MCPVWCGFGGRGCALPEPRYAIYFSPAPHTPLARLADAWFGDPAVQSYTESPRHYGFHATLKPPMALRPGYRREELQAELHDFAASQPRLVIPRLQVSLLGSFLALTLEQPLPGLDALAALCVEHFEPFRQPESPEAAASRRRPSMSARQLELLDRWGYPYVLEEWRFHMTLTSSLADPPLRATLLSRLETHFAPALAEPLWVEDLCLFAQPDRSSPFRLEERFPCSTK